MHKIKILKAIAVLSFCFISSISSFGQENLNNKGSFNLHINFQPTQGEIITKNLKLEEASDFDAPSYIAEHQDKGLVRIFGRLKNDVEYKYFNFDSSDLSGEKDCDTFCEKVTSLERVPYFGFAVKPMEDFSGVVIEDIIEGSNAADSPLQIGDIITTIESVETTNPCQLTKAIGDQTVDQWIEVNYTRNGKSKSTMVLMGYRIKKNVTWIRCCTNKPSEEVLTITTPSSHLDLEIFPNPTAGITQFEIATSSVNETNIQLMNMNGQIVKEMKAFPLDGFWEDYIDLSKFPDGVYVLHVTQDKATASKRIVLQKR